MPHSKHLKTTTSPQEETDIKTSQDSQSTSEQVEVVEKVEIKETITMQEKPQQQQPQQQTQQQPQQEAAKQPTPPPDRHQRLDPVDHVEPYTIDEYKGLDRGALPTASQKIVEKAVDDVYQAERKKLDAGENFDLTPQQQEALMLLLTSGKLTNKKDVLSDNINKDPENFVNDIRHGDNTYNTQTVTFKKTGDKVAGANAIAIFRSFMSIGDVVHVPLWHSGFWVVLKPPTQTEIVNLQIAITSNEINLGRDTSALIYSNYSVVFNRIVSDFLVQHINTTSLKLDDGEDIRDYISINDYYPLVAGLLATMNPYGIDIARSCFNSAIIDEEGKPKCTFTVKGKVDPKKLVWVNRKKITPTMLAHMSNRLPNSVNKQDIKEYQAQLQDIKTKEYEITTGIGVKFKVVFEVPSLKDNVIRGEEWVNEMITIAQKLFKDADTPEVKNQRVDDIAFASVLGIYNTFIKAFIYDDGRTNEDKTTFNTILSDISLDEQAFKSFIEAIKDFITWSPIALVATPNYICPECGLKQKDTQDDFKEFIPLNIVEHFFVQCAFRIDKMRNKSL